MWQVFAGTLLLASVLAVVGLWALLWAVRHLEDNDAGVDATDDLRTTGPAPTDARLYGRRGRQGDRPVALSTVQQDLAARLADRRREAAAAKVHGGGRSVSLGPRDSDSDTAA